MLAFGSASASVNGGVRTARRLVAILTLTLLVTTMVIPPTVAIAPPIEPTTRYVDGLAAPGGDGSAGSPFQTITSALASAFPGDTIMVAPGTYSADTEDMPLELFSGLTLEASEPGTGTILDGQWEFGRSQVLSVSDSDEVTVRGFVIRNGSQEYGGGAAVAFSSVVFEGCVFEGNVGAFGAAVSIHESSVLFESTDFRGNGYGSGGKTTIQPPSLELPLRPGLSESPTSPVDPEDVVTLYGGAVFAESFSMVGFIDSEMYDNVSMFAGGGFFGDTVLAGFIHSSVESNTVVFDPAMVEGIRLELTGVGLSPAEVTEYGGTGGGVAVVGDSLGIFQESDFERNHAYMAGGVYVDAAAVYEMTDSAVVGNTAAQKGGGVARFPWTDPGDFYKPLDISTSTDRDLEGSGTHRLEWSRTLPGFTEQPVLDPSDAGTSTVERTVFEGNVAPYGSALSSIQVPLEVTNSLFVANDAGAFVPDSALLVLDATATVNSSTFTRNTGQVASIRAVVGAEIDVVNTVFWDNQYVQLAGASIVTDTVPGPFFADTEGCDVSYSDTPFGDMFLPPGPGNVAVDPLFVDPDGGNFRLTPGSPVVDAGLLDVSPDDDLDRGDRPVDGDGDETALPDMGAYEYSPAARLQGDNRYGTAVAASEAHFDSASTVVVATGEAFPDGLAASGLAGMYGGPVLLTRPHMLPGVVADEVVRLGAAQAVVIGGESAVSGDVVSELEGLGLEVTRIGGADRYETAALIAAELGGAPTAGVAFVARGDRFPDALAVAPTAYALGAPVLLVRPDELPASTVDIFQGIPLSTVVVAGGKSAVDGHVLKGISTAAAVSVDRVGGADRYETAANISGYVTARGWSGWSITGLATGTSFPDALTGGPAIGSVGGVLLLTDPDALSPQAQAALAANKAAIGRLELLGDSSALSADVMSAAQAAIQ